MKKYFLNVVVGMLVLSVFGCATTKVKPLSVKLAESEMARVPNPVNLDFRTSLSWNYSTGLELYSFLKIYEKYGVQPVYDYVKAYADTMIHADGSIYGYEVEEYNIDHVNAGKLLFHLYDKTKDERYRKAADLLRSQMDTHPRTSEGGYWHKNVYPHQMWLDGLYMGAPFVAEYAQRFNRPSDFEDMVNQFLIVARHTYDPATKLYRHGWDESRQMHWADSISGQSQHAWGRACGWFMMGMVDILEFIPQETNGREALVEIFAGLAETLLEYRDPQSGVWYQVIDSPGREGNYLESSCSSMFAYAFLKGARLGYLPAKFKQEGEAAYRAVVKSFIKTNADGTVSLTDGCAVAGLGGKNMRDGSFEYYIGEPVRDNDPKAIGPFIMAALEMGE
ncbi:MAG: glycoside hydrolase family 88/105 protein [Breznakibacter sp.]